MRAETQNNVEAIKKSLKRLAQRMDWASAPHRRTCGTTRPRRKS